jgi:uncharacterized protein YjbJ (UPF0337 family)
VKGELKEWWGQLMDDDLDRIEGSSEKLIGRLQERYGWTRERGEEETDASPRELQTLPQGQYGPNPCRSFS